MEHEQGVVFVKQTYINRVCVCFLYISVYYYIIYIHSEMLFFIVLLQNI